MYFIFAIPLNCYRKLCPVHLAFQQTDWLQRSILKFWLFEFQNCRFFCPFRTPKTSASFNSQLAWRHYLSCMSLLFFFKCNNDYYVKRLQCEVSQTTGHERSLRYLSLSVSLSVHLKTVIWLLMLHPEQQLLLIGLFFSHPNTWPASVCVMTLSSQFRSTALQAFLLLLLLHTSLLNTSICGPQREGHPSG